MTLLCHLVCSRYTLETKTRNLGKPKHQIRAGCPVRQSFKRDETSINDKIHQAMTQYNTMLFSKRVDLVLFCKRVDLVVGLAQT